MTIPIFQVDAFTSVPLKGNPAAVCPLVDWLPDATMQAIAAENNLSETAFFVGDQGRYKLRWFTPAVEIDLCGHATLASAFVIMERIERGLEQVEFETRSGRLGVSRRAGWLYLDFPSRPPELQADVPGLSAALGAQPQTVGLARDILAVFEREDQVRALRPERAGMLGLARAVIASAPGDDCDFVSRFFAPTHGIDEDPVTGSSHCTLIPYWSRRLAKPKLYARQVSARGGELRCEDLGGRVLIGGQAAHYMEGTIQLAAEPPTGGQS
jgi:predicted PhzF superfamily epimerase YddE/YHI9